MHNAVVQGYGLNAPSINIRRVVVDLTQPVLVEGQQSRMLSGPER